MFNDSFLNYLLIVSEDYKEVQEVVDSFDTLANSINFLQNDLLEEVGKRLSMNNIELSVKRLESIKTLGIYGESTFNNLIAQMSVTYTAQFFDDEHEEDILKDSFVDEVANHALYLDDAFKVNLLDVYDSLEKLYQKMAGELCSEIQMLEIEKDSKLLDYVTYLSLRLSRLGHTVHQMVEGETGASIYDDTDRAAVNRMRELTSYNLIKPDESIYFYIGSLKNLDINRDILSVGSVLDTGYLDMKDQQSPYPINQSVAITLRANDVEKEDVFAVDDLYLDESGLLRIKLDEIINRLCVCRNGEFQLIR